MTAVLSTFAGISKRKSRSARKKAGGKGAGRAHVVASPLAEALALEPDDELRVCVRDEVDTTVVAVISEDVSEELVEEIGRASCRERVS